MAQSYPESWTLQGVAGFLLTEARLCGHLLHMVSHWQGQGRAVVDIPLPFPLARSRSWDIDKV